jgi:hypothetical protein
MTRVFILTSGSYKDYDVRGVYADEGDAMRAFIALAEGPDGDTAEITGWDVQ